MSDKPAVREFHIIRGFVSREILTAVDGGLRRECEKLLLAYEALKAENEMLTRELTERSISLNNAKDDWLAERSENAELREALQGFMTLVDEGILVRNTSDDADIMKFMHQSARLVAHLHAADSALNKTKAGGG